MNRNRVGLGSVHVLLPSQYPGGRPVFHRPEINPLTYRTHRTTQKQRWGKAGGNFHSLPYGVTGVVG